MCLNQGKNANKIHGISVGRISLSLSLFKKSKMSIIIHTGVESF